MTKREPERRCGHKNGCDHKETEHTKKRGHMPAYCRRCKHGRGAHEFTPRVEVTA